MFLIFGRSLNSLVSVLADKQNLRINIIKIFRLYLRPCQATKLFKESDCISTAMIYCAASLELTPWESQGPAAGSRLLAQVAQGSSH